MEIGNINITAQGNETTVTITGVIGFPEWAQFENEADKVSTKEKMRDWLTGLQNIKATKINLHIDSPGGNVTDAVAIVNALKMSGAPVEVTYVGYSASAATMIASSFENVKMYDNVQILIHEARTMLMGTASQMEVDLDGLKKTNEQMVEIYANKSGKPKEEIAEMLATGGGEGVWLTAQEAKELGLVDEILKSTAAAAYDAGTFAAFGCIAPKNNAPQATKINVEPEKKKNMGIFSFLKNDKTQRTATAEGVLLHEGELKQGVEVTTSAVIDGTKENADGVYNMETQAVTVEGGKVSNSSPAEVIIDKVIKHTIAGIGCAPPFGRYTRTINAASASSASGAVRRNSSAVTEPSKLRCFGGVP